MQTRALRSLLKIAKVGSFLKASEQLNMTLSALSMQMKALEVELGVQLFDRSVRPPRLTPMGRAVVDKAEGVIACEDALRDLCVQDDDLVGHFRVGFVTSAAARLLPSFLKNTQASMRRATFAFETGLSKALQEKVLTGGLDAAVVTGTTGYVQGLREVELRREPFVFAAAARIAGGGLEGLMTHTPFFHFMPQTGIGQLIADAMPSNARPADAPTIVLDNLEAIMGCVKAGLGFTLLPAPDVRRYGAGDLVEFAAPGTIHRSLMLVTRTEDFAGRRLDLLTAQFDPQDAQALQKKRGIR
ncbi:LysR family transcriptional regulator [uncultured Tateyamaria sp.]|uniref:LysR family transcriptional regulator n=1 Tax=uncultured Tateyamaria sp. TaxID=455651 RepID=UPI0026135823|nr:LysR family transcriptional regulator [uncultured Tateyamaria sp.]